MLILKEEQISLTVLSHRGHWVHSPKNMLDGDKRSYYSGLSGKNRNDWIIFGNEHQKPYYPTKVKVRPRDQNISNKGGWSLKRFKVNIGDSNSNEWIELNDKPFIAPDDYEMHTFDFDITSKASVAKSKCYKDFKLDILDNYGLPFICVCEFKLYGVPM